MGSFRYSEKEYPPSEDEGVEASQCKEKEKKLARRLNPCKSGMSRTWKRQNRKGRKNHFGKWTLGPERRGYHREALQWRVNKTKTQPADGERER